MDILRNCLLVTLSIALIGCTSMRPIALDSRSGRDPSEGKLSDLAIGDELNVTLQSSESVILTVTALSPRAIEGIDQKTERPVSIDAVNIKELHRREKDTAKTVLLVLGIIAGVAVLINILASSVVVISG